MHCNLVWSSRVISRWRCMYVHFPSWRPCSSPCLRGRAEEFMKSHNMRFVMKLKRRVRYGPWAGGGVMGSCWVTILSLYLVILLSVAVPVTMFSTSFHPWLPTRQGLINLVWANPRIHRYFPHPDTPLAFHFFSFFLTIIAIFTGGEAKDGRDRIWRKGLFEQESAAEKNILWNGRWTVRSL